MNVLLVEDDLDLQELYRWQLEGEHSVWMAGDAQSALDLLDSHKMDIILLDIILPYFNGLSVLQELISYNDWQAIPVIILSNLPQKQIPLSKRRLRDFGVVAYLEKAKTKQADLLAAVSKVGHE